MFEHGNNDLNDNKEDSDADSENNAHAEEASIFTTKFAKHDYEDLFRKVMNNDIEYGCKAHTVGDYHKNNIMIPTVKPLNKLIKTFCNICNDPINYHYLTCKNCSQKMCTETTTRNRN